MAKSIEYKVNELTQRIRSFRNSNPTEHELRQFYIDYLSVRRNLDEIDTSLNKMFDGYIEVDCAWHKRYPAKVIPVTKSNYLGDLFGGMF